MLWLTSGHLVAWIHGPGFSATEKGPAVEQRWGGCVMQISTAGSSLPEPRRWTKPDQSRGSFSSPTPACKAPQKLLARGNLFLKIQMTFLNNSVHQSVPLAPPADLWSGSSCPLECHQATWLESGRTQAWTSAASSPHGFQSAGCLLKATLTSLTDSPRPD